MSDNNKTCNELPTFDQILNGDNSPDHHPLAGVEDEMQDDKDPAEEEEEEEEEENSKQKKNKRKTRPDEDDMMDDQKPAASAAPPEEESAPSNGRRYPKRNRKAKNSVHHSGEKHEGLQPCIGMEINKRFEVDGGGTTFYHGTIVSGPHQVRADSNSNKIETVWNVLYSDDGQSEDLTLEEIAPWVVSVPTKPTKKKSTTTAKRTTAAASAARRMEAMKKIPIYKRGPPPPWCSTYEEAFKDLTSRMGIPSHKVMEALNQMSPPYGLNAAMRLIHNKEKEKKDPSSFGKFVPKIGLPVRKLFQGKWSDGSVTKDAEWVIDELGNKVKMWEVTYHDDGEKDDMTFAELFQWRASRPTRSTPARGRPLCALELLHRCDGDGSSSPSLSGVITQEFADRKWKVPRRIADIPDKTNGTTTTIDLGVDLMDACYKDIGMVPDFIWASPPRFDPSKNVSESHSNNNSCFYSRMAFLIRWAKRRNPHLIVCIEHPKGQIAELPVVMKELAQEIGPLYQPAVNYRAFGRSDSTKPTIIWTNDFQLHCTLSEFQYKPPPPTTSTNTSTSIPQALAEEIAEYVNATFYEQRIRYTKQVEVSPEEQAALDQVLLRKEKPKPKNKPKAS